MLREALEEVIASEGGAIAPTRTSVPQDKPSVPATRLQARGQVICLNDQGGSRMDVTHEMTSTLRAEAHHPPCIMVASGFCTEPSADSRSIGYREEQSPTLRAGVTPGVAIEFNPTDSRIRGRDDGICQTLCSRMGTGGNTIPDVVYALQGNGIDRALTAGCNGAGWRQDVSYTLNTIDRHAVVYNCRENEAEHDSSPCVDRGQNVVAIDCRNLNANIEISGTLQAKTNGGQSLNFQNPVVYSSGAFGSLSEGVGTIGTGTRATNEMVAVCVGNGQLHNISMSEQMNTLDCMHDQQAVLVDGKQPRRYIVRRLTPLECCRLQGFPDGWGDIPRLEIMTDADAKFWEDVRRTYAGAMGKAYRQFKCRDALVKWYNKLHTDSAEYKMWGNGIALPCAVFVVQGIAECVSAMEGAQ